MLKIKKLINKNPEISEWYSGYDGYMVFRIPSVNLWLYILFGVLIIKLLKELSL